MNCPPHQQSLLAITQSRPYRTVTRDVVTAALRSFPWEKRFLFCFSHLQRDPRVPSFFFLNKKRHPCKFLLELQALMSLPEKEGFERPTSKHGCLFSIPLVSRQTPCFSHLPPPSSCPRQRSAEDPTPRGARVPSFFVLKQKKTSTLVDVFTGEGGI